MLDGAVPGNQAPLSVEPVAQLSGLTGELTALAVTSEQVVALTSGGDVVGVDRESGQEAGRIIYPDPVAAVGVSARSHGHGGSS